MFGSFNADWLSEGCGYFFQVIGILIFSIVVKRKPELAKSRRFLNGAVLTDGVFMTATMLISAKVSVLVFGLLMNFLNGVVAGIYLTRLAIYVNQQKKSSVFGVAYGLGSIGTWLLSLPMNKTLMQSNYCLIVYYIIIGLIIYVNYKGTKEALSCETDRFSDYRFEKFALIALVIILLSVVKGVGFYFPSSESINGAVNLEFSRSFYAVGLILAGFIGDKNRKYGAICCLASLVFPFLSFALNEAANAAIVLWICGYIFFGFFSVYRVIIFCDIAAKKYSLIYLAPFGLMFGRIGDILGTIIGIVLKNHNIALIFLSMVLFIVTVFLFFVLYHKLYIPIYTNKQSEDRVLSVFENHYDLSIRECDVFRLIIKGNSNSEIAEELYISENTVKFHVKNILKKTDCTNRMELTLKYKQI